MPLKVPVRASMAWAWVSARAGSSPFGPTLLGELRKRNPKTRFVFVSGYAEEAFKKNLPEGESFHFLPKPFTMKQLVETVKAAMA